MLNRRFLLSISILFTFTAFILVCIATAGSTKDYKPITNIYMGDASIKHVNVSKIIPELEPVLDVLGRALLADGANSTEIFQSLRELSYTSALAPFVNLLVNMKNITQSLSAVTALMPLALTASVGNTSIELNGINSLLTESKNSNDTRDSLKTLMGEVLNNTTPQMVSLEKTSFVLLDDSKNPANTTQSLIDLSSLQLTDMVPLAPAFQLLAAADNVTGTFLGLETLMGASIPNSLATTMFTIIQQSLSDNTTAEDIKSIFNKLSSMTSSSETLQKSSAALEDLLIYAKNPNNTLNYLSDIVDANLTTSATAKSVMNTISKLYDNSKNQTLLLSELTTLTSAVGDKDVVAELKTLESVLSASTNQSSAVSNLETLQNIVMNDTSNNKYIPYLFDLLDASKDPAVTFASLIEITKFVQTNMAQFTPVLSLVGAALRTPSPTSKQIYDLTPSILEFLQIPTTFRLSIFSLCHIAENGTILDCSKPHAVQNLDFRAIIYSALINSEFKPYIETLDLSADDLYLEGKLLKKEHMYVPAVKAVLAFNILFIVSSFAIMLFFIFMAIKDNAFSLSHWGWFGLLTCSLACSLFSGLAATIVSTMITIIKSGTAHDKFNVDYTTGPAYCGLTWCAFSITFITSLIVGYMWLLHWKGAHNGSLPFIGGKTAAVEPQHFESDSTSEKVSKSNVITHEEKV